MSETLGSLPSEKWKNRQNRIMMPIATIQPPWITRKILCTNTSCGLGKCLSWRSACCTGMGPWVWIPSSHVKSQAWWQRVCNQCQGWKETDPSGFLLLFYFNFLVTEISSYFSRDFPTLCVWPMGLMVQFLVFLCPTMPCTLLGWKFDLIQLFKSTWYQCWIVSALWHFSEMEHLSAL